MSYTIRPVKDKDRRAVTDIFNYFIENSFAAYPIRPVPTGFFDRMVAIAAGYPFYVIDTPDGDTIGFGLLHRYHGADSFERTGELTYFILPDHTGHGLGTKLFDRLIEEARRIGIDNLLASISSLNEQSLRFHAKLGFTECGRFRRVGVKNGHEFDVVWVQKFL